MRIFSEFGVLGWLELSALLLVAVGCAGEMWILLNKLTRHIEPIGRNLNWFWRALVWCDAKTRPVCVFLKIKGRKLSEAKENLLERLFVTMVATGVGFEFVLAMFNLHEAALMKRQASEANARAGAANEIAAKANERVAKLESTNGQTMLLVEQLRKQNLELEAAVQWRTITPTQESTFIAFIKPAVDAHLFTSNVVRVDAHDTTDFEALWYAKRITGVLKNCGLDAKMTQPHIGFGNPEDLHNPPLGLGIYVNGKQPPPLGYAIAEAFVKASLALNVLYIETNAPDDGVIEVRVWHKPEK